MNKPEYQFRDKIILIPGSTQGIGAETAKLFDFRGSKGIVICGRNTERGDGIKEEKDVHEEMTL